jgi:hypothetical protein
VEVVEELEKETDLESQEVPEVEEVELKEAIQEVQETRLAHLQVKEMMVVMVLGEEVAQLVVAEVELVKQELVLVVPLVEEVEMEQRLQ